VGAVSGLVMWTVRKVLGLVCRIVLDFLRAVVTLGLFWLVVEVTIAGRTHFLGFLVASGYLDAFAGRLAAHRVCIAKAFDGLDGHKWAAILLPDGAAQCDVGRMRGVVRKLQLFFHPDRVQGGDAFRNECYAAISVAINIGLEKA